MCSLMEAQSSEEVELSRELVIVAVVEGMEIDTVVIRKHFFQADNP